VRRRAEPAPPASAAGGASRLEFERVSKIYPRTAAPAVDELSFEVPAGEICVLVGESGSGKTTALKMVNRLIEPTGGAIRIDGEDVRSLPAVALRRRIGYVIQNVGLLPHLTVEQNASVVPRLVGWSRAATRERVHELLGLVGLEPEAYARRYPAQLSGGQQQRVGLARALAADPRLMLMDEPFSAVDPIVRDRLRQDFLRLHRALPKTVLFVTHDVDEAILMGDRICVMRAGRLVQYAPPAELLARPADPFVGEFIGSDRALKALALVPLSELELELEPADAAPLPEIELGRSARDALALLLETGARGALVRGRGVVTVESIAAALRIRAQRALEEALP
jgi:osmoprotectant transport system ATP-binding protein